jgi:hypothetical protein
VIPASHGPEQEVGGLRRQVQDLMHNITMVIPNETSIFPSKIILIFLPQGLREGLSNEIYGWKWDQSIGLS